MITARALGLLMHLASNGLVGGVKALSGVFTEGRDALYSALNELIRAGLVKTTRQVIGSRYCTVTEVTDEGFHFLESRMANFLETRILIQQSPHNSPLTSNSILGIDIRKSTEQVREEYTNTLAIGEKSVSFLGQMDRDWDDVNEERLRAKAEKQKEFEAEKAAYLAKRYQDRKDKELKNWTVTDMTYEFARRVEGMWNIKPWRVGNSRFAFAFADFQKKYGTTREIELKLIDMFFARYAHETSVTDGEMLWKMFIKSAPANIEEAKRQLYTDDDMVAAKESAKKSWEKL